MQHLAKWFKNGGEAGDGDDENDQFERTKWTKRWNLRSVTSHLKKAQINAIIGVAPGTPLYMRRYSAALTSVVDTLTDQERLEYLKRADTWNKEEPPREVQMK